MADTLLPDRLDNLPELGQRPMYVIDGTYQKESANSLRRTPKEGGTDNIKGHAILNQTLCRIRPGEASTRFSQ